MVSHERFWRGKRVLVTGHTGFKGSWLSLWLRKLGAQVFGYALAPDEEMNLFSQLALQSEIDHHVADINDAAAVRSRVAAVQPDVVFHLAAQSLVRRSYAEPVLTWQTNVMGTAHVLDSLRQLKQRCAVVIVTTDKVYENREWVHAYRETDRLGGHDPYSASKAACELATESWRKAFFRATPLVRIASARAGNVIGGGDWAVDRIVPDLARALSSGQKVEVRNPDAIRPWQHVLDPLYGYMILARRLWESDAAEIQEAFNFGPDAADARSVRELVEAAIAEWPGAFQCASSRDSPHEAQLLTLTNTKARTVLGWRPVWHFEKAIQKAVAWYRGLHGGGAARSLTLADIEHYENALRLGEPKLCAGDPD